MRGCATRQDHLRPAPLCAAHSTRPYPDGTGESLGTTQRVISYYETKGELPPPDVLVALVRTLGASADELLGLKSSKIEQRKEDPKRRRLWKRFRKMASLPERDQRAVIRLINSLAGSKTQERVSA
jgi:hypothetical protein